MEKDQYNVPKKAIFLTLERVSRVLADIKDPLHMDSHDGTNVNEP